MTSEMVSSDQEASLSSIGRKTSSSSISGLSGNDVSKVVAPKIRPSSSRMLNGFSGRKDDSSVTTPIFMSQNTGSLPTAAVLVNMNTQKSEPRKSVGAEGTKWVQDRMTFFNAPDPDLEAKLMQMEMENRKLNKDLKKRAEDLKQLKTVQEETLGKAKAKLLTSRNKEIVIENLKVHIESSLLSQNQEFADRAEQQRSMALENKNLSSIYLDSQLNELKNEARDICLHKCPDCQQVLVEKAENYGKTLKNVWEDNATEKILNGSCKKYVDDLQMEQQQVIKDTSKKLWKFHEMHEKRIEALLRMQPTKMEENEVVVTDYHKMLVKLKEVQTLFNSVKKEYSNARELEQNFSRKYSENKLKLEELTESLQNETAIMRSRKRIFDKRSRARWLNQKLQKEKQLQFKLSNRKCKLQRSLSFLKDNFECSEKIHQNSISEIRRTTLPTLQKETRDMQRRSDSETVMLAHTKNMLQVYENRRNKLLEQEDKLKTDIKVAEIEKSRLIKRQSDNEIVMAQMESDVRSASIYFKKVSEEPRKNQMVVNSLQGLMKDSKQWLSRADRDIRYLSRLSTKMTKFLHRLQYFKISSSKCESLIKRELRAITNVVSDELFHRRVSAIIKESSIPIDIPTKEFDELRDMSATGLDRFQKTSETGEVLKDRFRRAEAQLDRRNESQTNLSDVYDDFEELRGARSLSLGSFNPTRRRSSTNLQMNRADNPKIKGNENDSDRK